MARFRIDESLTVSSSASIERFAQGREYFGVSVLGGKLDDLSESVDQRQRVLQLARFEDRSFSAIVRRALTAELDRASTAITERSPT